MANFIRCTQDTFCYKQYSEEHIGDKIKVSFLLFKTVEPVYVIKEKENRTLQNILVNLELVTGLSKCQGAYTRDENGEYVFVGYGIELFTVSGGTTKWIYDSESERDAQFEEIASNSHMFKQRVSI
jgi:hypothetical protein